MKRETADYLQGMNREQAVEATGVAARRLRELADTIERHAGAGHFDLVVHAIVWGVANLNIEGIVRASQEMERNAGRVEGAEDD